EPVRRTAIVSAPIIAPRMLLVPCPFVDTPQLPPYCAGMGRKKVVEYLNPSWGTKAAQEARRRVSKMSREERQRLFELGVSIANGQVVSR
ncbi:MAG: hypothetical protein HY300_08015, partial [Verrucomicrobia bacterium]|nr:hypothetical protein [Verrucomicrobiota bacterium]